MTTHIHPDGAYLLEEAANADLRRRLQHGRVSTELDTVMVSPSGKFCYSTSHIPTLPVTIFLPHTGDGEPRPQP